MRISLVVLNPYDQHQDRTYKSKENSQDSHLPVEVSDKGVLVILPPEAEIVAADIALRTESPLSVSGKF